ncbi:8-amino-7-oxononanoate synthase [Mycobacteroides abscessus subsp. massiliense]|nr:8-amino-7-oxononanoate synthase [Mycobacteroides abscessus subsp. massiliense]
MRGSGGRGLVAEMNLAGRDDLVVTVTLSKALGSQGGAVLGPAAVRAHLIDAARPFIFDTGLAPAAVGSALAALRLAALGQWCGVPDKPESAVVPVILGDPTVAFNAARSCLEQGVRVGCFRPPSVPEGQSLLRLTARASLTEADMERVHEVLAGVLTLARR